MLRVGGMAATELAERFDTPLYVYDSRRIEENALAIRRAFGATDPLVAYSVKANGNLAVLGRLAGLGLGADVTSAGELHRALRAGFPPDRIVYAGVGKTETEILAGLDAGIYSFHVESAQELERIERLARLRGQRADFGIRVNPNVEVRTPHEFTRTGRAIDKFGVPRQEAAGLLEWARARDAVRPLGLAMHIGSQIVDVEPYLRALDKLLELAEAVIDGGTPLSYVDMGGGFGIRYEGEESLDIQALADRVAPRIARLGLALVLEPGRAVVGEAGVLLTRVEYVKRNGRKTFVVVDGGMSELLRPSHYGGYHEIEVVRTGAGGGDRASPEALRVDVVGPVCESGDFLARDRVLSPAPRPGDLLAVHTVGAYGFAMASNYNGRPRPAEVMVEDGEASLARRRETIDDLLRGEEGVR